ncbi:MAG: IS5 family transposase [Verrucomicrobia bacterium]|nr:IS5 family transposase [Verrucomicrobiota bacterium]MBS0646520.1 IS5 family transposase [Verrucomicrobiota bacterium]
MTKEHSGLPMQTEPTYRIRNWSEYNRALIQRGSITIWIDEKAIKNWFSSYHTCRAGRPATYSDEAILMMLILREGYKRSLRSLEGFVRSLFHAMGLNLPVPSYSQISRRAKSLHKRVNRLTEGKNARHIIFDSTGLKVYGEGEWKMKVHGKNKRRTWRKFHIGIDAATQDIICCELTGNNKGDTEIAEQMLEKLPCKVRSARRDGAYDASRFRKKVHDKGDVCIVPPPRDAVCDYSHAFRRGLLGDTPKPSSPRANMFCAAL